MNDRGGGLSKFIATYQGHLVFVTLAIIGISNFLLRFQLLGRYAAPPSADFGLYLAHAHIFLGEDVAGFGPTKPPLLFLPLIGFLQVTDPISAVRLVSAIPVLLLPFPFYKLTSRYSHPVWAMVATIIFVFNEGYSEMTGWGGAPDILALAFLLGSLCFFLNYLERFAKWDLVLASIFLSLTAGSHLLTTLVSVLAIALWMLLEFLTLRKRAIILPFVKWVGLAAILSLPYIPVYLATSFQLGPELTPIWPDGLANTVASIQFLMRDSALLWAVIALLSVFGWITVLRRRLEGRLYISFVAVALLSAVTFLRDNPTRPLYYLYIPIVGSYPAFFTWAWKRHRLDLPRRERQVVSGLLVAFVVISSSTMLVQSVNRMSFAVDWYHAIDRDELEALNWLKSETPRQAVVATAGIPFFEQPEGTRYGWWIEGYAERNSFYAGSEVFAVIAAERQMVRDANLFFAGDKVLTSAALRISDNVPAGKGDPEISLWDGSVYRSTLYVDDAFVIVESVNATGFHSSTALYPTSTGSSRIVPGVPASIATSRVLTSGQVNRTESITGRGVEIRLSIRMNTTIRSVLVPFWTGPGFLLSEYSTLANETDLVMRDELGFTAGATLQVSLPPGGSYTASATNADPEFGVPRVLLNLTAPPSSSTLDAVLDLEFPGIAPSNPSEIRSYDAFSIAAAYGVTYVFQSERLFLMNERFREDALHFRPVYANPSIVIYALNSGT